MCGYESHIKGVGKMVEEMWGGIFLIRFISKTQQSSFKAKDMCGGLNVLWG